MRDCISIFTVLTNAGFDIFDYTLTGKTPVDVEKTLRGADVIFVSGGNTFYLLEQARKSDFGIIVKELTASGVPYIGSSAGSVVVGRNIEVSKFGDDPHA